MIAAGCRFFSGYPMTPFTEVLEHMAAKLPGVGGTCMNAESELEAVGMAWGAAATGTPSATGSTGQGLSLMQESLAELAYAAVPMVVLNMARAQGDYWQATRGPGHGDARMPVLAPMDVPEAAELTQLAFHLTTAGATRCCCSATTTSRTRPRSVTLAPLDLPPVPADDWSLDGATSGTGRARLVSPLGSTKRERAAAATTSPSTTPAARRAPRRCSPASTPLVEIRDCDDAEVVVVAFGTPAKYVRAAVARLRAEGARVGYVRPITLLPFPSDAVARAVAGARIVGVYENNQGQMVDDVRLAVAGATPGRVHRPPEPRRLGVRHRARPRRRLPARADRGAVANMTDYIPTDAPPTIGAHLVDDFTPSLLDVGEHSLCPGCGEPIAMRAILEAIETIGAVSRAIGVFGIGCYTAFSNNLDIEVLQALHGRAPSLATGVKRAKPDTLVITLQGDGDMVNEGLQEVLHTARAARTSRASCSTTGSSARPVGT